MSCSSSPPPLQHHAPALDLLDEYWFFSNTLFSAKKKKTPPRLPRSPSTSTGTSTGTGERLEAGRRLLRTPSLPSSRVGVTMELPLPTNKEKDDEDGAAGAAASGNQQPQSTADEVDDDDLNWSSIYEGVLRTRMAEGGGRSALRRAPSMPVPLSAMMATDHQHGDGDRQRQTKSTPSMPRLLRHSHSTLGRQRHTPTPPTATKQQPAAAAQRTPAGGEVRSSLSASQQPSAVARCLKKQTSGFQFQGNKCKSSSDLESIEVQGFRDLGFVLDKEDVLPGLKTQSTSTRRPALARVQSAAEMKDQLRMWAQAVACNVRQEC